MKNKNLYKYINLLFRITIGVVAVWFIYSKIEEDFLINFRKIVVEEVNYRLIFITLLLMILNWSIETVKWKYAIRSIQKISFFKALKYTFTGITMGLLTPNRIGEIPSRAWLLNNNLFKEITLKTSVASFAQLIMTLLVGVMGFAFTYSDYHLKINPVIIVVLLIVFTLFLLLVYFKVNKLEVLLNKITYFRKKQVFNALSDFSTVELINIFLLSLIRYLVFSIQFYLVLIAFNIPLVSVNNILLIPVCFMLASFIPSILISEIGIRGAVAVFVFGTITNMEFQIIMASILLWMINVALPALIGIVNLKEIKIIREH